jgi:hypothetical protein
VELFVADVRLRFEAESVEAAGGALRRLQGLVRDAGFELSKAKVTPSSEDEPDASGWTGYAPLDPT